MHFVERREKRKKRSVLEKYILRRDAGLVAEDVLKLKLLADQTPPPNEEQETSHITSKTITIIY